VDCIYAQSIAAYMNGDYKASRAYAESILRTNPTNEKARECHLASIGRIEEKEKEMNLKIGGGVVAVGVGLAVGILGLVLGGKK